MSSDSDAAMYYDSDGIINKSYIFDSNQQEIVIPDNENDENDPMIEFNDHEQRRLNLPRLYLDTPCDLNLLADLTERTLNDVKKFKEAYHRMKDYGYINDYHRIIRHVVEFINNDTTFDEILEMCKQRNIGVNIDRDLDAHGIFSNNNQMRQIFNYYGICDDFENERDRYTTLTRYFEFEFMLRYNNRQNRDQAMLDIHTRKSRFVDEYYYMRSYQRILKKNNREKFDDEFISSEEDLTE